MAQAPMQDTMQDPAMMEPEAPAGYTIVIQVGGDSQFMVGVEADGMDDMEGMESGEGEAEGAMQPAASTGELFRIIRQIIDAGGQAQDMGAGEADMAAAYSE